MSSLEYSRWYRKTYPEKRKETCKKYIENNKFRRKISVLMGDIKYRCENKKCPKYKYYGGRGIKNFLTVSDLINLWNRDNANLLKNPSIDRIDNNKDYNFDNCRFIEISENRKKGALENRISKEVEDKLIEMLIQKKLDRKINQFSKIVKINTHSISDWIKRKHHITIKSYNKLKGELKWEK